MNLLKAFAPTVVAKTAEIEFVEVSGGGDTAADSTYVGTMEWDNVANKTWD